MPNAPNPFPSQVRQRREWLHLRPGELAALVQITRQALHSIETGAYMPNTLVALRLAQALECRVEDLFRLPERQVAAFFVGPDVNANSLSAETLSTGTRVHLARVDERWLAFPLTGEAGWGQAADGLVADGPSASGAPAEGGLTPVDLLGDLSVALGSLVLVGCDPALGLAAVHAGQLRRELRVLWRPASSLQALRSVARGEAHAAGIHLWEAKTGVSNLGAVQRELPDQNVHLHTLWSWEQGLMVAPGNPHGVSGPESLVEQSLVQPGLRLINREQGAGSRVLLDAWLHRLGLKPDQRRNLHGYRDEAGSHLEAAAKVAAGLADVAPGPRSAAQALGLGFVPVQRERFDLVIPDVHREHPALLALLTAVQQPALRTEVEALGGYDAAHAGEFWQSTA